MLSRNTPRRLGIHLHKLMPAPDRAPIHSLLYKFQTPTVRPNVRDEEAQDSGPEKTEAPPVAPGQHPRDGNANGIDGAVPAGVSYARRGRSLLRDGIRRLRRILRVERGL